MIYTKNNPWLGLESYQENQIIYGRDEEISDLSQRVLNDVDTVLYGKSGIGKTSIINAGILPIARQNGYVPIVVRLDHSNSKKYIEQIRSIVDASIQVKEKTKVKKQDNEFLWEYLHRHEFWNNGERCKLLIIFDQFEEIFTLQDDSSVRTLFFKEVGDVLNDIMPIELTKNSDFFQKVEGGDNAEVVEGFASMSGLFSKKIEIEASNLDSNYINDNNIHFIFALREDFLSDFEYYTAKIPSLKHHRFGLRPINEEQAAEIICKPQRGLVSKDVALLIIQKITQRKDFSLDGIPEIEVDSAVLSLFLKSLYESKSEESITKELVENKETTIISDFYHSCVEGIAPPLVEKIENLLVNEDGNREIRSLSILNREIGERTVLTLLQRMLIRMFPYGREYRVELIHDILCSIIVKCRSERAFKKEQQKQAYKKALKKLIIGLCYIVVFSFICFARLYSYFFKKVEISISLMEMMTIANEDYWKSEIMIISDNDTVAIDTLDKVNNTGIFHIPGSYTNTNLQCHVNPVIGNIEKVTIPLNIKDSLYYNIFIDKQSQTPFLEGKVRVGTGSIQPVIGAIVIWGNQVVKTNSLGLFSFNKPTDYGVVASTDSTIKIIKQGYNVLEDKIHKNNEIYKLVLKNPDDFYIRCNELDKEFSQSSNKIVLEGTFYFNGRKNGRLEVRSYISKESDGKKVRGCYFYPNKMTKAREKHQLYILFEGNLNENGSFLITATDDAWNKRTLSGNIYENSTIKGYVYSNNERNEFKFIMDNNGIKLPK